MLNFLHDFLKQFNSRHTKVHFKNELYSLRIKKDKSPMAQGALGRDSLVCKLMNDFPEAQIRENCDKIILEKGTAQDFINSFQSSMQKNKDFLKVARDFKVKYSTGCINVFRYYMMFFTQKALNEDTSLMFKEVPVDLRKKPVQKRLYTRLLRMNDNAIALRLALAHSNHYKYTHIDFEYFLNLMNFNYKTLTKQINNFDMSVNDTNGIIQSVCRFTLFLKSKGIFIYPCASMSSVTSSHGDTSSHLHRHSHVLHNRHMNQDFQDWLSSRYNILAFHDCLKFGIIMNPWMFILDEWKAFKMSKDEQSFRWKFIHSSDEIINRFKLTRLNDEE